jgi:hypothetical protein
VESRKERQLPQQTNAPTSWQDEDLSAIVRRANKDEMHIIELEMKVRELEFKLSNSEYRISLLLKEMERLLGHGPQS